MDGTEKERQLVRDRRMFQDYGQLIWLAGAIYTLIAVPLGAPLLPDITIAQHLLIGIGFSILLLGWQVGEVAHQVGNRVEAVAQPLGAIKEAIYAELKRQGAEAEKARR